MPLDPQAQALLDQFGTELPLKNMTPQEARQLVLSKLDKTNREKVGAIEERLIPGPGKDIYLRIYRPEGSGPFPVLVYFHGGGWVLNSVETHDHLCRALTNKARCLVISVEYSLSPEYKYPHAVQEAYLSVCWVAKNAASFDGNPERIGVGGDSSGGNLAAVVTLLAKEQGFPQIYLQLLLYPSVQFSFDTPSHRQFAQGYYLTRDVLEIFWRSYLPNEEAGLHPHASPLLAPDLSGLPQAVIVTAEYDPLRDEAEAYAQRLRDEGVPVELYRYEGMIHGFVHRLPQMDRGREALEHMAARLAVLYSGEGKREK